MHLLSQWVPSNSSLHLQVYFVPSGMHVPPFLQSTFLQGSTHSPFGQCSTEDKIRFNLSDVHWINYQFQINALQYHTNNCFKIIRIINIWKQILLQYIFWIMCDFKTITTFNKTSILMLQLLTKNDTYSHTMLYM